MAQAVAARPDVQRDEVWAPPEEHPRGAPRGRGPGGQADRELPFAGLQQLFGSMLGPLERLPDPQREAVAVAFGLRSGPAPDRFEVGLAMLGLLAEVVEQKPLVCVVDDR